MTKIFSHPNLAGHFVGFVCLVTISLPAHAHEEDPLPVKSTPAILLASLVIATVGLLLLAGLFIYRGRLARQHRRAGRADPFVLPWFSRALYSLLAVMVISGMAFAAVRNHATKSEHAKRELHGNAIEATIALEELLETTPAGQRFALLKGFANDPSPGLRLASIDALGALREPGTADILEQAFRDNSASVRERALELLPDVDRERGRDLLLAALRDEDTMLRETAVRRLVALLKPPSPASNDRLIPHFLALLDDPEPAMVVPATIGLSKITGKPWRARMIMLPEERAAIVTRWRRWLRAHAAQAALKVAQPAPLPPTRRDTAPVFRVTDIEGKPFDLAGRKGRVTLLNFWGTWCPPCRQELPELKKVDSAYRSQGVDLLGLTLSEPEGAEGVRQFCRQQGIRYRQAICTRQVQADYGEVTEVPVTVLIDRKGDIRYRWEGPRDYATFQAALERVLREP